MGEAFLPIFQTPQRYLHTSNLEAWQSFSQEWLNWRIKDMGCSKEKRRKDAWGDSWVYLQMAEFTKLQADL